ncbi:methyltransferase [Streptomyces sp. NPDC101733]|uniref:methyltransferase n=1 Tax=unclassified Streptomyces TaxID=2593676 RepID=UPI0037F5361C
MTDTAVAVTAAQDIEAALTGHARVREAALVTRRTEDGTRLVGYIVPDPAADTERAGWGAGDVLDSWQNVFDDTYESADEPDGDGENSGWVDSFTGDLLPTADMTEWADESARRVLELHPRRILEIGAGTGLIMRRVLAGAPIEHYVATDFSARSVELLDQRAAELAALIPGAGAKVTVRQADALRAPQVADEMYDTVVINSVAQYFPSLYYFEEVVRRAAAVVRPGGHILLGDLRNARLAEAFTALKVARLTPAGGAGAPDAAAAREAREAELAADGELSLDPAWLAAAPARLARVSHAEIAPRRGVHPNEMTLFRFDALLHVDCPPQPAAPGAAAAPAPEPGHGLTPEALRTRLERDPGPIAYRGVPNSRLREALTVREDAPVATSPAGRGPALPCAGLDPEQVWRLGEELARPALVSWAAGDADGAFDVSFPAAGAADHFALAGTDAAGAGTDSGTGAATGTDSGTDAAHTTGATGPVVPYPPRTVKTAGDGLRAYLARHLPAPPAPLDLVLVTALPRTATGALAPTLPLPRPGVETATREAAATRGGDLLGIVLAAFAQQLPAGACGPDDRFFSAGGGSLKAAMCVRRLREQGLKVTVRDIYQCGTARALADRIAANA